MNIKAPEHYTNKERIAFYDCPENKKHYLYSTRGGWEKYAGNPVLGGDLGTCFDMSLLKEDGIYKMWFSWRTCRSIAYVESKDGIHWNEPAVVLEPVPGSAFEADEVNRPCVIKHDDIYKMWYSGQMRPYMEDGVSVLVYAESADGIHWEKRIPVLEPEGGWEMHSVMCPHVMYDEDANRFKLWYSAGCNHEPDAIGYAESDDGIHWEKHLGNPVLEKNPDHLWEQHKVVACQVIKYEDWYYMFYVGHMHEERAAVGMARSRNGVDGWEKHPENPLISPEPEGWDAVSVYKPFVMREDDHWALWYNGAQYDEETWVFEQIGLARLYRRNFGFQETAIQNVTAQLTDALKQQGADQVYYVDITSLPSEMRQGFPRACLILKVVSPSNGEVKDEVFGEMERQTDCLAEWAQDHLIKLGYSAFGQSERNVSDAGLFEESAQRSVLPHKTIALMAGLGWIGKHDVLVTPEFGSALSMCTVLTDAPLDTHNHAPMPSRCDNCTICRDICPEQAITGALWEPGMEREALLDAMRCTFCYQCVAHCPWTVRYAKQPETP